MKPVDTVWLELSYTVFCMYGVRMKLSPKIGTGIRLRARISLLAKEEIIFTAT